MQLTREDGIIVKPADIKQVLFDMSNSPVVQCPDWSPFSPYDWQAAIWWALWRAGAMVAARTCNESGKTSAVVPVMALSWAAAFPGAQVVVTSASERQFEKQLIPSFENMISSKPGWKKSGNTIKAPSQDGLPPSEIVCFATKSGELFEGFHNRVYHDENGVERYCPLLIIVDEAKSIKSDIYTAIERCNPTAELRISTCGEDSGGFYDACMNEDGLWTTGIEWPPESGRYIDFKIPWTECPHLMLPGHTFDRKMAMLQKKGANDPIVRSILLAEFFRSGEHMVFTDADMAAVQECQSGLIPHIPGRRVAFCDLSGGGDERTFGFRDGNRIHPIITRAGDSHTPPSEIAMWYIKLFIQHHLRPEDIYCDNGGLGAEIIKEMHKRNWPVKKVNFGAGAIDASMFSSRITEIHWEFKSLCYENALILPNDDKLIKQMRLRRYTMKNDDSNRISLEDKKAVRRRQEESPDRLETVVGLLIDHEPLVGATEYRHGNTPSICGTAEEYMKKALSEAADVGDGFGGGWSGA